MHTEQRLLRRPVGLVVVVIEPGFTDPDHLRVLCRLEQGLARQIGMGIGIVRVDADAGPNICFASGGSDHLVPLCLLGRDVEETLHASLAGT